MTEWSRVHAGVITLGHMSQSVIRHGQGQTRRAGSDTVWRRRTGVSEGCWCEVTAGLWAVTAVLWPVTAGLWAVTAGLWAVTAGL